MRTIYALGLVVTIAGSLAAQGSDSVARPMHSRETLESFEHQIFAALFKDIRLSGAQDSAAHAAIHESLVKRERIQAIGAAYMQEASAIVHARDDRIRDVLQNEQDRARFDRNAKVPIFMLDGIISTKPEINRDE